MLVPVLALPLEGHLCIACFRLNPDANDGDPKTPAGVTGLHMSSWLAQDKWPEVDMSTYGWQYPSPTMKYIITRHYATQNISAPHIYLLGGP
jgi:hypothetical protein